MTNPNADPHMQYVLRRSKHWNSVGGYMPGIISIETEFSAEGAKLLAFILRRNSRCGSQHVICRPSHFGVSCSVARLPC